MKMPAEFDEIRPYAPEELPQVFEELIADPAFRAVTESLMPEVPFDIIAQKMRNCKTNLDFQKTFCYGLLWKLVKEHAKSLTMDVSALKDKNRNYTFISNHRDIILDSAFLSILLMDEGMNTVEIAIGDNLLIYPWIKKIVRVNKSFIVKRALNIRQKLEASALMSRYMHFAVSHKHENIWIAQRQGRAKDSNDRTQDSVLKMMAMGGEGSVIDRLKELNIVPLAISYEYDPCDYLKAKEMQEKRDNPDFEKSPGDDLLNMQVGLFGYKGNIHFQVANCINDELSAIGTDMPKTELFSLISKTIDRHIHRNYRLYPCNYIACDLLMGDNTFEKEYTEENKAEFENYLEKQIAKIDLANKDIPYLRHQILNMYANPLINYIEAAKG